MIKSYFIAYDGFQELDTVILTIFQTFATFYSTYTFRI